MSPDDPRHGTEAGHEQHLRDGEESCAACIEGDLRAGRRRSKRKVMGHVYMKPLGHLVDKLADLRARGASVEEIAEWAGLSPSQVWRVCGETAEAQVYTRTWDALNDMRPGPIVTPTGITRRIRALVLLGYSLPHLARETGCDRDTIEGSAREVRPFVGKRTTERILAAFERLDGRPPEIDDDDHRGKAAATRARRYAAERGWLSSAWWDDIDDPRESATTRGAVNYPAPELVAEWDHLRRAGVPLPVAAERLGVTPKAIEKALARVAMRAA